MEQLLFCLEANKKSRSDWFYISEAIRHFYNYDTHKVSIRSTY